MPTPDWKEIPVDKLEKLAEALEWAVMEKEASERVAWSSYTVVLEWRGWRFIEVLEGVALGAEFYRDLPNGKRGLFGEGEIFVTADSKPGILFHCLKEE